MPQTVYCLQPTCRAENPAHAAYCAKCGAPLAAIYGSAGESFRSVGLAYGLWALSLVLIAGLHRFYVGKYITGVIWLLTGGLFGIGTIIDLFLVPGMVERKNRRLAAEGSWQLA